MTKAKPKPTRIVAPPVQEDRPGERGGRYTFYPCDDGNSYTQEQLGRLLGVSRSTMGGRIRRYGWDHPQVLNTSWPPSCGRSKKSGLMALSDRVRSENLDKIKLGTFEVAEMWEMIR